MILNRKLLTKVSILAIAALMISAFVVTVPMSSEASYNDGGSGTEVDPYIIKTIEELQAMNDDLSAYYELGGFILAEGEAFTPIGNETHPFTGSFDGSGYLILNVSISSTEDYVGLFGHVGADAVIKEVGLEMINVTAEDNAKVGGLVGHNSGTISESFVTGLVGGNESVGGLVGWNEGVIINCFSLAVVGGYDTVGGLVGWNGGEVNRTYAAGEVINYSNGGGLIGMDVGGDVVASYYDNETTNLTVSDGGYGRNTTEMMNETTFVDWDFEDVWRINEGESYPRLKALLTLGDIEDVIKGILDDVCNSAGVILFIGGVAIVSSRRKKA